MTPSYLAGIMDGEGAIMLPRTGKYKLQGMYTSFCLKIQIANTNLELLSSICSAYGGMIRKQPNPKNKNWKQGYMVTWFGKDAKRILDIVYPELIVKRKVADLAYKYLSFIKENPPSCGDGVKPRGRGRSFEQVVELNKIAADVKCTNKRGVA